MKIVILGESAVGKSAIIQRIMSGKFVEGYGTTIGASFFTRSIETDGQTIKLEIWDTAGQERYRSLGPMYYRDAHALLITYDITAQQSFEQAQSWVNELERYYNGRSMPMLFLLGNKRDLADMAISDSEGRTYREVDQLVAGNYAREHNMCYFEVSAKTGHAIAEFFGELSRRLFILSQSPSYCQANNSIIINPEIVTTASYRKWRCC